MNEFYYVPGEIESEKAWSWIRKRSQIEVVPHRLEGNGYGKILEEKEISEPPCLIIDSVHHVGLQAIMDAAPAREIEVKKIRDGWYTAR
jgi:hypothetical protein